MEKQMITKVNFGKRLSDLRIGGETVRKLG